VGITVDTDALAQAARGYQDSATAVQGLHGGLSSALDQVAAAAANGHISAGTATLHSGLTTALRALADSSNQYATKVTQAATTYRAADKLASQDAGAGAPAAKQAAPPTRRMAPATAAAPTKRTVLGSFGQGVFGDGLMGAIHDLGNLVGFGGWDGLKQSWGTNLKLALALDNRLRDLNDRFDLPGLPKGTLTKTLVDTGKGLVAWDRWKEDPARAAGNVVFNGVSILYGPKVVGATVKGASAALKGAAAAGETAAEGAAAQSAAARTASTGAATAEQLELRRLIAEQAADDAAGAQGKLGISSTAEASLDPWRPEPKPEPGRIPQLDPYKTAANAKLDRLENMDRGNDFNRTSQGRYPVEELQLNNGKRLDGYVPGEEIVTRKSTQLADVNTTAEKAVSEVWEKYSPGNVVADVPKNRQAYPDLVGKPISGQVILEVPVQHKPVPAEFGDVARRMGVTIRDEDGRIHN
jgi:hypothetical protein